MSRNQDYAEALALGALGWLAGNDDLFPIFLGASGLAPEDLHQRAGEAEVLASVLDFVLMDDTWVQAFCDTAGFAYDEPRRARVLLPGNAAEEWT